MRARAAGVSGGQLGRNAVKPHISDQDRGAQEGPVFHSTPQLREPCSFPDIPVSEAPSALSVQNKAVWLYSCV